MVIKKMVIKKILEFAKKDSGRDFHHEPPPESERTG